MWSETLSYRENDFELEMQHNLYNFEVADTKMLIQLFELYEAESKRVIETPVYFDSDQRILTTDEASKRDLTDEEKAEIHGEFGSMALVYPALDLALKCSHIFNLLDARGAISVTERAAYINRVRNRVRACCQRYVDQFKVGAAK
jgi:glycyl-tRNA synthetase alpha chain